MIDKIKGALGSIDGKVVGVFGLAFKPKTDDIRDSPAVKIVSGLIDAGAHVSGPSTRRLWITPEKNCRQDVSHSASRLIRGRRRSRRALDTYRVESVSESST